MSWTNTTLGLVCELYQPQTLSKNELDQKGHYKVYGANGVIGLHTQYNHAESQVLITCRGATCGTVNVSEPYSWINGNAMVVRPKQNDIDLGFLAHYLKHIDMSQVITGAAQPQITRLSLSPLKVCIPPIAEQQRIAAILDKAEEIRRKRLQAIEKLDQLAQSTFENILNTDKSFKKLKLIDLIQKKKVLDKNIGRGKVWNLTLDQIDSDGGEINAFIQVDKSDIGNSTYYFEPPVLLYSKLRPYLNKVVIPEVDGYATTELVPLYCNEEFITPVFLLNYLKTKSFVDFANTNSGGAKMPRVMMDKFWAHEIKVPPKHTQLKFGKIYDQIKAQKTILKNNLITQNLLFKSLQHQAFTTGFNA